ncbi:AraC family transcriptional regulator [Paenibacillus sp. KS-LC4]|uniref:AraC family transcriptional regulator n=1 Tax=Paenibacillus sp. KS-LC4 TaxID=2979727 RepID=UPI0030D08985
MPLEALLFSFQAATELHGTDQASVTREKILSRHTLFAMTTGDAIWQIEGKEPMQAQQGDCLVLPPGAALHLRAKSAASFRCARITFDLYKIGQACPEASLGDRFPYYMPLAIRPLSLLLDALEQLLSDRQSSSPLARFKQQIKLQELIAMLLEQHERCNQGDSPIAAVESSVAYMKEHYCEPITVEKLLQLSGVGRWQYSTLFQSLTGRKPLDYLTELRLNRAKELLLLRPQEPLREIAHSVGFQDEYYFNRRFRNRIGLSPKQYVRRITDVAASADWAGRKIRLPLQSTRIVAIGYSLGDMLTLGIRPIGADLSLIGKQVVFRSELQHIADVGSKGDTAIIAGLEPELILHCNLKHESPEALARIAPTLFIEKNAPTYARLRQVADILGKTEQAERWIADYESRAEAMWKSIRPYLLPSETASIFVVVRGDLYVMGNHGLAPSIYHPHGFGQTDRVKQLYRANIPFLKIDAAQLEEYSGSRIFLLSTDDALSKELIRRIVMSKGWKQLPAVRSGRFHIADAMWNFDDPLTRDRLLNVLPRLLRQSS